MKNPLRSILLLLFCTTLLHSAPLKSTTPFLNLQQSFNQDVENIFQKALKHYSEGRYDVVEFELQGLLELYPQNHRSSAIAYLMGRAQYKQKKYTRAEQTLRHLIEQFPRSQYVDDARFLLAAIAYKQSNYVTAGDYLLSLVETSDDLRLIARVETSLVTLLTDYLQRSDLQSWQNRFQQPRTLGILHFATGVIDFRQKNMSAARGEFQWIVDNTPQTELVKKARTYLENIALAEQQRRPKVGVLLPLSGFLKEEAKGILTGIQYALQTNPRAKELGVELLVKDTAGEVVRTIKVCRELLQDEEVIAVIGEVESDKTAVIGSLLQPRHLPVLAPTAAETGLAQLTGNIIQMNPDVSIRGQVIAEFAINDLGLHSFVILAPADPYGKTITDSFTETVDRLNGSILAETWYYQGATEVRSQFRHIREIGLQKMKRDSVMALMPDLTLSQIDSVVAEWERQRLMEEKESNQPPRTKFADSTATPVTSIDAIFLPVYTDDIPYVAPQFALFNIQCQIIGGDYWNDEDILDNNSSYVDGAIFSSDFYADPGSLTYQRFRNRFRMETGITPGKMEIYGYDTMNFLLQSLRADDFNPEGLLRRLRETRTFQGLLQPYTFDKKIGVNSHLNILKYQNNTIRKIK